MSTGPLTTTSYAILGLLGVRSWSSYELTRQMSRSLGHMWPRAESKLYEEPKKLVAHGLAKARTEQAGRRTRTVYAITPKGRRALAAWLAEPGGPPALEFEGLLKVFFADHGTTADLRATLAAAREWATAQAELSAAIGREYVAGRGPFPERGAVLDLTARFLSDFYGLVAEWAAWADGVTSGWPDEVRAARADPAITRAVARRAERAARR